MKWNRVTKAEPCGVCNRGDWCTWSDIGRCCMRLESGKPMRNGGWLHPLGSATAQRPAREAKPDPILDVVGRMREWRSVRKSNDLAELSANLGVTVNSLESLGCVRAPYYKTWAFPMCSGDGHYCGIRLRNLSGEKWAERGSHQGLFMGTIKPWSTVMITEGPTDAAAAITLGLEAMGRPSSAGGVDHIKVSLKRIQARRAVIVADMDDPGLRGAKTLQEHLPIPSAILTVPSKDLRSFVKNGGSRDMLDSVTSQLIWRQPQ